LFTKLALVDIGVEGEVVLVPKKCGNFAYRESQLEEVFDPLLISVKLAFLKRAFRLAKPFALFLFGCQCFFGP